MAVPIQLDSITEDVRATICGECSVKQRKSQYVSDPKLIECFEVSEDASIVYIPLGQWRTFFVEFPYVYDQYAKSEMECTKTLYTIETDPKGYRDQDVVAEEAYSKLVTDHVAFISANPGYGKTGLGNFLACRIGLKTLVVSHIDKVNDQWVEEFGLHSSAKVQKVVGKKPLDPTADVYVIGMLKLAGMDRSAFDGINIGLVIFDEAHVATVTAFSKSLLKLSPLYVLGLSATPERADGMQKLLTMYFGPKINYIHRQEVKDFTVYKYETDFKPTINYNLTWGGTILDWTTVINSIAYQVDRQQFIATIASWHPSERMMILSDRTKECDAIHSTLVEWYGETEVYKMDNKNKNDSIEIIQQYRILIAGRKRAGIGFNDPTRNMLVLCTDCIDVRQNEGRVRTSGNIIYDLVDNFSTFETHWTKRETWYLQRGADVQVIPRAEAIFGASPGRRGRTPASRSAPVSRGGGGGRRLPPNVSKVSTPGE